jgi:phage baseplate assembly protein W
MIQDETTLVGRGISFPPRIGPDGRIAWSSGAANVNDSIRVILLTEPGERLLLAGFGGGLGSLLFEPNNAATHRLIEERITQALHRWEPRIDVDSVTVEAVPDDPQAAVATVIYHLVATRTGGRVDLTVRLAG